MDTSELLWVARYHETQAALAERHLDLMDRKVQEFGLTGRRAENFIALNGKAITQASVWLMEPAIRPYLEAVK